MRLHKFLAAWVVLLCLVLGFCLKETLAAEPPRITKEELQAMMDKPDVIIIDVRAPGDWMESQAKIKGAVREDPVTVRSWMDRYPKDKTLVFYCA